MVDHMVHQLVPKPLEAANQAVVSTVTNSECVQSSAIVAPLTYIELSRISDISQKN